MAFYKNIWFYVAAALLALFLFTQIRSCKQLNQIKTLNHQLQAQNEHYRDKQGYLHTTAQVLQIPQHLYKHIADSVVQSIAKDVKAKDLVQHSEVTTTTTNRDTVPYYDTQLIIQHTGDTATGKYFVFKDDALSLTGLLFDGQVDINYNMQVQLKHTTKWQRKGWFKKKQLIVDVYSITPHTTVTGLRSYTIQPPPKRWYQTDVFKIGLGVGLGFIIRNNIK